MTDALNETIGEYTADPVRLLQQLIQFDTTNPPGNEAECVQFIAGLLDRQRIESQIYARTIGRPNLLARLPGRGDAPPLLLYGHVDVVTTQRQSWRVPPFEGRLQDGYIWGRGTLDMKGAVAMMITALLRLQIENVKPPGDVLLAVLSDEEAGGVFGARFMVEEHPELFAGVKYALGEFGGFNMQVGKRRLYPIQVAEKQLCWITATVTGKGGHGSMPRRGEAMWRLSQVLEKLDRRQLPVHITPPARQMIQAAAEGAGGLAGFILRLVLKPGLTDVMLMLMGEKGRLFAPLLHNTASPNMLQASDKINVIPSEVSVGLDGRLLPGMLPQTLINELQSLLGEQVRLEVVHHDPGVEKVDMGYFETLAGILKEADPAGYPIPFVMSGVTDGRFFSRLGIQTYGFTPMQVPEDFKISELAHAADERIPVEALSFGAQAIYQAILRNGG